MTLGPWMAGCISLAWSVVMVTVDVASAQALIPAPGELRVPCGVPAQEDRDSVPRTTAKLRRQWFVEQRAHPTAATTTIHRTGPYLLFKDLGARVVASLARDDFQWRSLGPYTIMKGQIGLTDLARDVTGRATAVVADPTRAGRWLVGSAGGGVWETADGGKHWQKLPGLSGPIGSLALDTQDPRTILAGTGEGVLTQHAYGGAGLFVSDAKGKNWQPLEVNVKPEINWCGVGVRAVHVSKPGPMGKRTVVFATHRAYESVFSEPGPGEPSAVGVFSITVTGSIVGGSPLEGKHELRGDVSDLQVHPANFDRQYAGLVDGTTTAGVYRKDDRTGRWTRVCVCGSKRECDRPENSECPWEANPSQINSVKLAFDRTGQRLYASVAWSFGKQGHRVSLWWSDDPWAPDAQWSRIALDGLGDGVRGYCAWNPASPNPVQSQCDYSHTLSVDPADRDTLYAGGIALWKCTKCTSGSPFWEDVSYVTPRVRARPREGERPRCSRRMVSPEVGIHVDQQAMTWVREQAKTRIAWRLIVANDGGVWSTTNSADCWESHNRGLGIAQMYRGAVHPRRPALIWASAQDIGTIRFNGERWQWLVGGDGAGIVVSYRDPDTHWGIAHQSTLVGGSSRLAVLRTRDGGETFQRADLGVDKSSEEWVAPFVQCPDTEKDVLLLGTEALWRVENFFKTPSLPSFEHASPPSWQLNHPKLQSIRAIAFAAGSQCQTYAFAVPVGRTPHSKVYLTSDGGASWKRTELMNVPGITALAFDPTDASTLYVTASTYQSHMIQEARHILKISIDRSVSKVEQLSILETKNLTPSGPGSGGRLDLPFHSIVIDPKKPKRLLVGSELGVWITENDGAKWCNFGPRIDNNGDEYGMPLIPVMDLKIHQRARRAYAFTLGLGAWGLALAPPDVMMCGGAAPG